MPRLSYGCESCGRPYWVRFFLSEDDECGFDSIREDIIYARNASEALDIARDNIEDEEYPGTMVLWKEDNCFMDAEHVWDRADNPEEVGLEDW